MTADVDALITRLRSVGRAFEGLRWLDDAATTLAAVVAERDAATRQLAEARAAIEKAPHGRNCLPAFAGRDAVCCCWKADYAAPRSDEARTVVSPEAFEKMRDAMVSQDEAIRILRESSLLRATERALRVKAMRRE